VPCFLSVQKLSRLQEEEGGRAREFTILEDQMPSSKRKPQLNTNRVRFRGVFPLSKRADFKEALGVKGGTQSQDPG